MIARQTTTDAESDSVSFKISKPLNSCVLHMAGDIDERSAPSIVRHVVTSLDPLEEALVISLSGVRSIDPAGLSALVELKSELDQRHIRVVMVRPMSSDAWAALKSSPIGSTIRYFVRPEAALDAIGR
jgi:anti-anti-sigma factor